jgi:hypothetical protein
LLKKSSGYKSGPLPPAAEKAFLTLKNKLINAPVQAYQSPNKKYFLATDAATGSEDCKGGFGAVLTQPHGDCEKVISYASCSLKDHEKNYSAFLAEKAAANWGIDHFSVYLKGRHFTLFTDHRPLEALSNMHTKTFNRLQENINSYNFTVKYRKGECNAVPDALSCNPVDSVDIEKKAIEAVLGEFNAKDDSSIAMEQRKDPFINAIISYLQNDLLPPNKDVRKRILAYADNEILYFILHRKFFPKIDVIMVPKHLQSKLIKAYHDTTPLKITWELSKLS